MVMDDFLSWLADNSAFYDNLEEVFSGLRPNGRILVVGPFALPAAALMLAQEPDLHVEGICPDLELRALAPGLQWKRGVEGRHETIYAPMVINYIPKKDLVPFLFDVHDALEESGRFIFSFHDSPRPDLGSGRSVPLWFSSKEAVTKYYTLYDMVNTLAAVGFSIRRIDEVEGDGIIHAVSLECVKGKV